MFCSSCGAEITNEATFCGKCGNQVGGAVSTKTGGDQDKLLIVLAHLGGIFFGFIPSLIVFILRKDTLGSTLDNAREALNWQLSVIIYSIACFVLSFIVIGLFLFWILILANLILCILATIKSGPDQVYRYPFTIRLLKP
jgi:uncharacterized Tic20 family protein